MEETFSYSFTLNLTDELKSYFENIPFYSEEEKTQWKKAKASAIEIEYEEYKD